MKRTPVTFLVAITVVVTAVGWLTVRTLESRGTYLPVVPWLVDVALVLLATAVLWAGWSVRAYQKGRKPDLDGLRAARTLALGKAAAMTGSALTGWYLAQVLVTLGDLSIEARRDRAIAAGIAALAAVVLAVAGVVVEHFCQLPPPDGEEGRGRDARMSA